MKKPTKKQAATANNLDLMNWLLTKEGNPNAEINFKRVVELLADYRNEFKIIDNIRVTDKIKQLYEANLKELNTTKDYDGLLNIERDELQEVSDTLNNAKKQLQEWIESTTNQTKIFKDKNMNSSALSSGAMRIAYTNAKNLL